LRNLSAPSQELEKMEEGGLAAKRQNKLYDAKKRKGSEVIVQKGEKKTIRSQHQQHGGVGGCPISDSLSGK